MLCNRRGIVLSAVALGLTIIQIVYVTCAQHDSANEGGALMCVSRERLRII